jgi:hypothetical protein
MVGETDRRAVNVISNSAFRALLAFKGDDVTR